MLKRSLPVRALVCGFAIVQMAVPGLAAVADARLTADAGAAPQVHIEDHTHKSCRPVHADDCVLCQLLTHCSAPRDAAPVVPAAANARLSAECGIIVRPAVIIAGARRTRAPPVGLS